MENKELLIKLFIKAAREHKDAETKEGKMHVKWCQFHQERDFEDMMFYKGYRQAMDNIIDEIAELLKAIQEE